VIEIVVEFMGGPLDGTTRSVGVSRSGRPPDRYTVDLDAGAGPHHGKHEYRMCEPAQAGGRSRYEYRGVRPG
jgi:hypothetical protein